jgi:non-heme chloroperoxidase
MAKIDAFFNLMFERKASDVHLSSGNNPIVSNFLSVNSRSKLMKTKLWALFALGLMLMLAPASPAQSLPKGTRSGFVNTVDGVKLHYLEAGTPAKFIKTQSPDPTGEAARGTTSSPSMLLIPGWTMPAWIWEKQIEHFSQMTRVVAMDPRAQGKSTKTSEGLYPDARAKDIKAVVDQLHLAPVVLVAWSMGANEVASYIDQFGNEGVAGIVLVDGSVNLDDPFALGLLKLAGSMMKDRPSKTEAFVRMMYKKPLSEAYIQRVTSAALETPTAQAMALFVGSLSTDNRPALAKFARPTLLVITKSPVDPVYFDMQKRIPGARLEQFDDAGHALFVDDADRFNALLDQFLRTLKASAAAPSPAQR